jgi:hypothetical protein
MQGPEMFGGRRGAGFLAVGSAGKQVAGGHPKAYGGALLRPGLLVETLAWWLGGSNLPSGSPT